MQEEIHVEHTAPRLAPSRVRRASWGAIFSGMFVTIVLQVMFTLLGVAVGIAKLSSEQQNSGQQIATASGIWLLVSGLVAIWIGSCIAGRLSGGPRSADGMLHGIVSWSVAMVAMFGLLATTVGALLGGTVSFVNNAITANSNSQGGQGLFASAEQAVSGALSPTGRTEGQQPQGNLSGLARQDPELGAALGRMEANGGAAKSPQDRDQVVNILTTRHNLSQQDAMNEVNQWDQQFQQVHAQAANKLKQAGNAAAGALQQGALWGFIALLLGLVVGALGGWAGTASLPRPTEAAAVRP